MSNIKNKKVRDGINSLILSHPFFASILLQQEVVEDNNMPTFAVDGKALFYNDDFANALNHDQTRAVLAHEVLHIVLLHHCRLGKRDPKLFNEAADLAINPELEKAGFKLPRDIKDKDGKVIFDKPLIDPRFDNMSAEDIYRILEKEQKQNGGGGNNKGGAGQNPPGNNKPSPGGNKGSSFGDVIAAKNPAQQEKETKVQINQAESFSKMCGKNPYNIERLIQNNKSEIHDWREIVNRFVSEAYPKDYSWNKPNKRFLQRGIILPSLDGKVTGKFVIACDTSGSVGNSELRGMVSEIYNCLETILEDNPNIELPIIYCDAQVHSVDILTDTNDKTIPRGGGGTSFLPVFEYIKNDKTGIFDGIKGLIYITDGYCGMEPIPEQDFKVLWDITTDHGMSSYKRAIGENMRFDINH
jgi:predicted metal-dependent peptidase